MGNVTVPFDLRINKESKIYQIVQTSEKKKDKEASEGEGDLS